MNYGILTIHYACNFGANLQTLATSLYLQSLGHKVTVINYQPSDEVHTYKKLIPQIQFSAHESFIKNVLNLSELCADVHGIINICKKEKFDGVFIGSDAVLRLSKNKNAGSNSRYPNPFWGSWSQKLEIPAVLYSASSMGSLWFSWPRSIREEMASSLYAFAGLTVRDDWTKWMCRFVGGKALTMSIIPDPVIAIDKFAPDIIRYVGEKHIDAMAKLEPYIAVSFSRKNVKDAWISQLVELAHQNKYNVVSIPMPEGQYDVPVDHNIDLPLNAAEWYWWIKKSSGYIGERFHGLVSAVATRTPFVTLDTYSTPLSWLGLDYSSKIFDLCKRIDCLNNRFEKFTFRFGFVSPNEALKRLLSLSPAKIQKVQKNLEEILLKETTILIKKLQKA